MIATRETGCQYSIGVGKKLFLKRKEQNEIDVESLLPRKLDLFTRLNDKQNYTDRNILCIAPPQCIIKMH